jgi:hypothetical protein
MKPINLLAAVAVAIVTVATLGACGKKNTESTPASTPASTCQRYPDGTSRDQYGRTCSNLPGYGGYGNGCVGTRYDATTGRYISLTTGQVVQCNPQGYFDGYNSLPINGMYGNQQINSCDGWTPWVMQRYQQYAQYVPVDIGNGQLVCLNANYLSQQMPQQNWNQYAQMQQPIYMCTGCDCTMSCGYGGGYGYPAGYGYSSCNQSFNVGFSYGGFGASAGWCQ